MEYLHVPQSLFLLSLRSHHQFLLELELQKDKHKVFHSLFYSGQGRLCPNVEVTQKLFLMASLMREHPVRLLLLLCLAAPKKWQLSNRLPRKDST